MSNADILGLFVWHELMTTDPQGAAAFYSGLFEWHTQPSSTPDYRLWMSGSMGVGGLMTQPDEVRGTGTPPSWLIYLGTANVDATVEAVQRLGGRTLKGPTDIPGTGRFAVLSDPQGAAFAVFTPDMSAPSGAAAPGLTSPFSWHELATTDPQGALDFYSQLFGWSRGPTHDMGAGNSYQIIEHHGAQVGGLYRLQDPSKPPYWLTYVKVDALDGTVSTAKASGGQILQEPHEVPGGDRVARILDPQGGAIALHEPPRAVAPARPPAPRTRTRKTAAARRPARAAARPKPAVKKRPVAKRAESKPTARTPTRAGTTRRSAAAKGRVRKAGKVKAKVVARSGAARGAARGPKARRKTVRKIVRKSVKKAKRSPARRR